MRRWRVVAYGRARRGDERHDGLGRDCQNRDFIAVETRLSVPQAITRCAFML